MTSNFPNLITVNEFCAAYRVGRTKTYALLSAGEIEAVKLGTRTMIRHRSAEAWLERQPAYKAAA